MTADTDNPEQGDDSGKTGATHMETLRGVMPYVWPADRPDLRLRVVLAMVALVASKIVTVAVPFSFKEAVDVLTGAQAGKGGS